MIVDTFARDNLPPKEQWPEFRFDLPELQYTARMNRATVLLDAPASAGPGARAPNRAPPRAAEPPPACGGPPGCAGATARGSRPALLTANASTPSSSRKPTASPTCW